MQIFKGNECELKTNFNLSPMGIVWVGVLRGRRVFLTEPFLELCSIKGPLENLLKDQTLAAAIDDPAKFEELQAKHDPEHMFPLAILNDGEKRILALEAEIAAETGWQSEANLPAKAGSLPAVSQGVQLHGLESLFSQEEIAKLKLAIATTVKADEKIEAIRKMALSQVPAGEKGVLFLHALGDRKPEVRAEAARALHQIGFGEALVEAITTLSGEDRKQREYAIGGIAKLFANAGELEKGACLQILLTTLRDDKYQLHRVAIVKALGKMIKDAPSSRGLYERIMISAVETMVSALQDLVEPCSTLFAEIIEREPELATDFLWSEVGKSEDRRVRTLLLIYLAQTKPEGEKRQELAKKMVLEISSGDEIDPIYLKLAETLIDFGEEAVLALLDRFAKTEILTERIQDAKLLDTILSRKNLPASLKERTLIAYTEAFPVAPKSFRLIMLDSPLVEDNSIDEKIRQAFAAEFLVELHRESLEHIYNGVNAALCRMKKTALAPLCEVLESPIHPVQGIKAASILGNTLLELSAEEGKELEKIKKFCIKQLDGAPEHRGELFKALGKMTVCKCANEELASEITDYLFEHLCKTSYPYNVLEALGWAGSSRFTSAHAKTDICYLFTTLMDRRLPKNIYREKQQKKQNKLETIFEFDFKSTAYTDLLPCLITGLSRLGSGMEVSSVLRKTVVDYFLKKWNDLAMYRVVWGPKSITDLAVAMQGLCVHPEISSESKRKILNALQQKISVFSVMELLTSIFQKQSGPIFACMAQKVSARLLEYADSKDYHNAEDREVIMRCIGQITKSEKLAELEEDSQRIRKRLLYTLFDGLREKVFGVREALEELRNSPALSRELKKEIDKRLPSRIIS